MPDGLIDLEPETEVRVATVDLAPNSIATVEDLQGVVRERVLPLLLRGYHAVVVPRGAIDRSQFPFQDCLQPADALEGAQLHQHHAVGLAPAGNNSPGTLVAPRDGVAQATWEVLQEPRWRSIIERAFDADRAKPIFDLFDAAFNTTRTEPNPELRPAWSPRKHAEQALVKFRELTQSGYDHECTDDLYALVIEVQRKTAGIREIVWKDNDFGVIGEMVWHGRKVTEQVWRDRRESLHIVYEDPVEENDEL